MGTKASGGYALSGYTSMRGDETIAFRATLTLDGRALGEVSNDGRGGSNLYRLTDPAARKAFLAFATALTPESFEPDDALIERLIVIRTLNRSHCVAFLLEGDDPFVKGTYHTFQATTSFADAVDHLVHWPRTGSFVPSIWVNDRSEFVPVAELASA